MHKSSEIEKSNKRIPEMINFYNNYNKKTKFDVDMMDKEIQYEVEIL